MNEGEPEKFLPIIILLPRKLLVICLAGLEIPGFIIAVLGLAFALLKKPTKYRRLYGTEYESPKQIETKEEIDLENSRPVFELKFDHQGLHPIFKRDGEKTIRRFSGKLLNKGGTVSSIDLHYNYQEKRPENLEEILNNRKFFKEKDFGQEFGGLARNGTLSLTTPSFDWSGEKSLWLVLWIDYEYLNGIKEECVFDLNINGETVPEQTIRMFPHPRLNPQ